MLALAHYAPHVHDIAFYVFRSGEKPDLFHQLLAPLAGGKNTVGKAMLFGSAGQIFLQESREAQNGAEKIVEVVRNPPGQLAERLQFSRVSLARLVAAPFGLHLQSL